MTPDTCRHSTGRRFTTTRWARKGKSLEVVAGDQGEAASYVRVEPHSEGEWNLYVNQFDSPFRAPDRFHRQGTCERSQGRRL